MGYPRRMAAGLPNNIVRVRGVNVNQIQFGDKLQGLIGVTNRRVGVNRHVRTKCGGHLPGRATVFCINQLGGVYNRKNSQFAPNADGVNSCTPGVYGRSHEYGEDKWVYTPPGVYGRSHEYGEDKWVYTPPVFSLQLKLHLTAKQLNLVDHFESYPYVDTVEDYNISGNTEFGIVNLRKCDFKNGTLQIKKSGVYILQEDIIFEPNKDNAFMPTAEQIASGLYPSAKDGGAYHLGFFAAIAIETEDVILDLNGFTIEQSREHSLMQRFYANIELANAPFIMDQGPGSFTTESKYRAAKNVLIMNGKLGRSSHHGIHGNRMEGIILRDLVVEDFEVAGIALNGAINSILVDITIRDTTKNVPILSSFSQAVFMRSFLERIKAVDPSFEFQGKTIVTIIDNLNKEIDRTKLEVLANQQVESNLFRNPNVNRGYDGNVYGLVLNVNGVVINDFLQARPDTAIGNQDIYVSNIKIENLVSMPIEIIGLSKSSENALPVAEQAYGGKRQVGTAGDVLDILRVTDAGGRYVGNVLSDGQLIAAKYKNKTGTKMGTTNILQQVVEWAEGSKTIAEAVIDPLKLYYIKNGDSMGHLMKGNIGIFISGGVDIRMDGVVIDGVTNHGAAAPTPPAPANTGNKDKPYKGASAHAIVCAVSKAVLGGVSIGHIDPDNSRVLTIGDPDNVKITYV